MLAQSLTLRGEILGSGLGQLHSRFLSCDQLTQLGDLRVALLRGFPQLGQGLTHRSELFLIVGALLGGLVKSQARIVECTGLSLGLFLQLGSTLVQHPRILAHIGHNLPRQRTCALLSNGSQGTKPLLNPRERMPRLIDLFDGGAGFLAQRFHLFDAHLDLRQLALRLIERAAHLGQFAAHQGTALHRLESILGIQARLGVT